MNETTSTVIIAPMITKLHNYPTRIKIKFQSKEGWIVLDQIRTVDKIRLIKKLGKLPLKNVKEVKQILSEMFVE